MIAASAKPPHASPSRPSGSTAAAQQQAATPRPAPDLSLSAFSLLLKVEADTRTAANERELRYLMANETLGLVRARQIFVMGTGAGHAFHVNAVSSLAIVDRNVPLLRWIEDLVSRLKNGGDPQKQQVFTLPAFTGTTDKISTEYPFAQMLWMPLWSRYGGVSDGLLLARDTPWTEADAKIASRLAQTYGHALALLRSPKPFLHRRLPRARLAIAATAATVLAGIVPVRISVLAPAEVVPRDHFISAMPIDGIVEKVLVEPNETVAAGQPLLRLVDTIARNKFEVALREVAVAEARSDKAHALAFSDAKGRHELGIAQAELELRIAEFNFAKELLDKTVVTAQTAGIAIFSGKKQLEGRPLATGDQLIQVARPGIVELRIDLPVADSIVLEKGARVQAFLDSDPLHAFEGEVSHVDYHARLSDTQVAVHRVTANFKEDGRQTARLGTRGTAQIYGPQSTLGMYLFRRPLSALRQWVGL